MGPHLPSVSGIDRATNCDGSSVLPNAFEEGSIYASIGTGVHTFIVRAREVGRDEALAEVALDADHRRFCEQLPLDKLPQGGRLEAAFAYDPETDTARVLGLNINRAYLAHGWKPESEIPGTADIDGVLGGDTVYLRDYKTGHKRLGPPDKSSQLRLLALAASRARGLDKADIGFFYLREDGTFYEDRANLNAFDLADIADETRALVQRIRATAARYQAGEVPNVSLGSWCEHCTSLPFCPAQVSIARSIAKYEEPGPLTVDAAAKAWAILDAYDVLAERARRSLRDFAKTQPIPLLSGKELRLVDWTTTKLDTAVAKAVLVEKYGEKVGEAAVQRTVTQGSIEDAIRGIATSTGGKLAPLQREILTEIEIRRGLTRMIVPQVRAMAVPKPKKPRKVKLRIEGDGDSAKPVVDVEPEAATA